MEEKTRTLTGCKQCGRGYPYKELVNGLCKDCNMGEKKVGYRVIYMPGDDDKQYPIFNTKEEAYAFIDGLNWYCKISTDQHPCVSCSAEYMVFEEDINRWGKVKYTREKAVI